MGRAARILSASLVAGCALGAGAPAGGAQSRPAAPAATAARAAAQAAAEAEAARVLVSLPLPAGTAALGGEPPEAGGALSASPNPRVRVALTDATGWWTVPGPPRAAIEYVHQHLPDVSPFSRAVFPAAIKPGVLLARIRLLEGTGPIAERWVVLTATALPGGSTAMRGDVQALYVPAHDRIPAAARAIRVTITRLVASAGSRSFLVTARPRVHATERLIDALRPRRPSLLPVRCSARTATTATVRLGFLASARARTPLAVATATIGGCGGVDLAIRGKPLQPGLESPPTGFVGRLERALGRTFPAR